nr:MAG TPA: hypothetical protein [Caudoviricetes sp.]
MRTYRGGNGGSRTLVQTTILNNLSTKLVYSNYFENDLRINKIIIPIYYYYLLNYSNHLALFPSKSTLYLKSMEV